MNFFKSKFFKNGLAAFQITRPGSSRNTLFTSQGLILDLLEMIWWVVPPLHSALIKLVLIK